MERTVGVPLISPVEVSRVKPVGRAGLTAQEIIVPPVPVMIGDSKAIATLRVSTKLLGL